MQYAIFDMDGTLIDSMPAWNRLGAEFLRSKGIVPPADLRRRTAPMTMLECGAYAAGLGVPGTPQQIADELHERMAKQYRETIPLREGVTEYLQLCREAGMHLCVATATNRLLAETCLSRLGLLAFFSFVISCEDIGKTKTAPDIFLLAAEQLGASPTEAVVYEDMLYPAQTAKNAGFPTVGVYDPASGEENARQLRQLCTAFIEDWRECKAPVL